MSATSVSRAGAGPQRRGRQALAALEILVAANAAAGAVYGLVGAPGVPDQWLNGSPFSSYLIPSLILLVGVGGSMALAAAALILDRPRATELSIAAGLILLVWIVVEMAFIPFSWLQPTFLAVGLVAIGLALATRER